MIQYSAGQEDGVVEVTDRLQLPLLLLLVVSCTTGPKPAPDWIINQPTSPDAWIGIGYSAVSGDRYRETARNKAIDEIASQIEVHIESSLKTITTEMNYSLFNPYNPIADFFYLLCTM